jgi:hypothetical protein
VVAASVAPVLARSLECRNKLSSDARARLNCDQRGDLRFPFGVAENATKRADQNYGLGWMEKHWFEANATKRATWKYGLGISGRAGR